MFSKTWKSSKNPNKQRKYRFNAPLHIKRKFLSTTLSKELRKKYNKRSVPVIKGDKVKILRGSYKGKTGSVIEVNVKKTYVHVDVAATIKKSGSKVYYPINPSNLMIVELNLKDEKREASLTKNLKSQKNKKENPKDKEE